MDNFSSLRSCIKEYELAVERIFDLCDEEKYPKEADVDINERYSYNFTISILDLDRNKLYIYDLDT